MTAPPSLRVHSVVGIRRRTWRASAFVTKSPLCRTSKASTSASSHGRLEGIFLPALPPPLGVGISPSTPLSPCIAVWLSTGLGVQDRSSKCGLNITSKADRKVLKYCAR